ncbi:MAG: thioredoxin family protein [Flavobacteriales bacterium]|nr:thioredoxin family protein [Flavobacteriales bacterium]
MIRVFSLLVALLLVGNINAQSVQMDSVTNKRILVGPVAQSSISDSVWHKENYDKEKLSKKQLKAINTLSENVTVEVYFGTWCSDSRYWVPAFMGVLDKTNLADKIELVAVSRSKKTKETAKLEEIIELVPTFVFWRDGKELGRIVETPKASLVKDMIKILQR